MKVLDTDTLTLLKGHPEVRERRSREVCVGGRRRVNSPPHTGHAISPTGWVPSSSLAF